jgi:pyruvate kinase
LPSSSLTTTTTTTTTITNTYKQMARFDFAFGDAAYHQEGLDALKAAAARAGRPCAVAMDTLGPEIVVNHKCVLWDG